MYLLIAFVEFFFTDLKHYRTNRTFTSKIGKLVYRFSSRLLDYYCEEPPPLIVTCIGFDFYKNLKGKTESHIKSDIITNELVPFNSIFLNEI